MPALFWKTLNRPIVGLSPMDGVTDAAFRFITAKYGKPAVSITEFTSAEGIAAGAIKLLQDFSYSEIERPVVAQIFGSRPDAFFKAAVVVCALGFDGLDINMGCPARNVAEHGGGAALIKTPKLAQGLVRSAKTGVRAWADGITLEQAGVHEAIINAIRKQYPSGLSRSMPPKENFSTRMASSKNNYFERKSIPISIKTRIGYDTIVIEDWVQCLLEAEPAAKIGRAHV